jgi:hypothetical protein
MKKNFHYRNEDGDELQERQECFKLLIDTFLNVIQSRASQVVDDKSGSNVQMTKTVHFVDPAEIEQRTVTDSDSDDDDDEPRGKENVADSSEGMPPVVRHLTGREYKAFNYPSSNSNQAEGNILLVWPSEVETADLLCTALPGLLNILFDAVPVLEWKKPISQVLPRRSTRRKIVFSLVDIAFNLYMGWTHAKQMRWIILDEIEETGRKLPMRNPITGKLVFRGTTLTGARRTEYYNDHAYTDVFFSSVMGAALRLQPLVESNPQSLEKLTTSFHPGMLKVLHDAVKLMRKTMNETR